MKLKPGIISNGSKKQGIVDAIHPLALLLTGIECACARMRISPDGESGCPCTCCRSEKCYLLESQF